LNDIAENNKINFQCYGMPLISSFPQFVLVIDPFVKITEIGDRKQRKVRMRALRLNI